MVKQVLRLVALVLLVLGIGLASLRAFRSSPGVFAHGFGSTIAYWAASQLAWERENPYSPARLLERQRKVGWQAETAQMYWNPPWSLVLFAPVMIFPFFSAALLWLFLNAGFLALLGHSAGLLFFMKRIHPLMWLAATFLFVPALSALKGGQVTVFVSLSFAIFLLAYREKKDFSSGVALGLVSLKPQFLYLPLAVALWQIVSKRRWRIVTGAVTSVTVLIVVSFILFPSAWHYWQPLQGSPTHWATPTLGTFLRSALMGPAGEVPVWPIYAIPLLTLGLFFFFEKWRRCDLASPEALTPLLCVSLITAPYCWLYDNTILVLPQVFLVSKLMIEPRSARTCLCELCLLIALQLFAFVFTLVVGDMRYGIWFPPAFLAVWYFERHRRRKLQLERFTLPRSEKGETL